MSMRRTLTSRLREGFELRNAKSTASWSMADLLDASGSAVNTALSRARGPEARLAVGSSAPVDEEGLGEAKKDRDQRSGAST